ncbi:hypothetical protein [Gracilinema caldarium]|uniref:hypothetical protein n=1 Tax=Gracilinema caldarium TaxID=215591 RepID=UPI0026F28721|nr:hypothetical protein [Gracilinema caldarium]
MSLHSVPWTTSPSLQFPPVESWKAALMQLSEAPFFDILRSYLGDIKTPFNKQRLIDDLAAFLSRQEIHKRIACLLDDTDRRCIAAVGLLGSGTLQDLALFFEGDFSFADLYGIVLNLEERLIIFRTTEEGRPRLNLNPLLAPVLTPIFSDLSILFAASPLTSPPPEAPVSPVLALGTILGWLYHTKEVFKSDGTLKKRSQQDLDTLFAQAGGHERAFELIQALEYVGLLRIEEGHHHVDEDRLEAFASLEPCERLEYLASALVAVELELDDSGRRLSRERLQNWARLVQGLLDSMQQEVVYSEGLLRRFWLLEEQRTLRRRFGERGASVHAGPAHHYPGVDPLSFFKALLRAMEKAFLIVHQENGFVRTSASCAGANQTEQPSIVCDASFSVIVYPEIPMTKLCHLIQFCRPKELGQTLKLELSQEGLVRALDRGFKVDEILRLLEQLAQKPVVQSIAWSLEEWARRYESAALYKGLVLTLAPERRYIAELDLVAGFIDRELAPGVYLLRMTDENQLVEVLEKAGLDTLARPEPARLAIRDNYPESPGRSGEGVRFAAGNAHQQTGRFYYFGKSPARHRAPFNTGAINQTQAMPSRASADTDGEVAQKLLADLHAKLEQKHFTKEQRDELAARIDRRLILDETQLVAAAVRYEKLEARGLDYVGKVRLAEQALSQGALVELYWRGPKGEANRAIVRPLALEKSGAELMLRAEQYPEGEVFTLAVGKISLLRRLKRSIFGD